jgi:hypothetical protein
LPVGVDLLLALIACTGAARSVQAINASSSSRGSRACNGIAAD